MRMSYWSSDVCSSDLPTRWAAPATSGGAVDAIGASPSWVSFRLLLSLLSLLFSILFLASHGRRDRAAHDAIAIETRFDRIPHRDGMDTGHRAAGTPRSALDPIGRASCRERVCQSVLISVVVVSLQ